MKIYAIKNDREPNRTLAFLLYYEKVKTFYIELEDDVDEWEAPLLLSTFVGKGKRTINAYWSKKWVRNRIIPQDRQNIGMILRDNHLKSYDEFELLRLGHGRCAQDDYFIEEWKQDSLPDNVTQRFLYKVEDVVPLEDYRLLVFFMNGDTCKCSMKEYLSGRREYTPIITHKEIFENVQISTGNYGIHWGEQLQLLGKELYETGTKVDISRDDFISFVKNRVINAAETARVLNCSRQNINSLVKREQLIPIKSSEKETLFSKRDVQERLW